MATFTMYHNTTGTQTTDWDSTDTSVAYSDSDNYYYYPTSLLDEYEREERYLKLPSCLFEIEWKRYIVSLRRKLSMRITPILENIENTVTLHRRLICSISGWVARVGYRKKRGK